MFKRVVVGIDRVDANHAPMWDLVGRLSAEGGARVVLAHVTEVHPARFGLLREGHGDVATLLDEATNAVVAHGGLVDKAIELPTGLSTPATVLSEFAQREGCDLIVVGAHSHGPWSGALLGSVSDRIAGHGPCPVLVVPSQE